MSESKYQGIKMKHYVFRLLMPFAVTLFSINILRVQANGLCGLKKTNYGEFCCDNEVHNITTESGIVQRCCEGHGIYIPENKLCCAGQLIERYGSDSQRKERKCCSSDEGKQSIYTPDNNELCCRGVVSRVQDRKNKDCCGSGVYDRSSQRCCESDLNTTNVKIFKREEGELCCGGSIYKTGTHWCKFEKILKKGWDSCDGQEYDIETQFCCEYTYLVKLPEALRGKHTIECIQGQVFDFSKDRWEKSLNKTIKKDEQVCGKNKALYKKNTQVCCGDDVYVKKPEHTCCGGSYVDTNSYGCCRSEPYNKAKEDCCNGQLKISLSAELKCCNATSINTTEQVCCSTKMQEIPTNKMKKNDNKCCKTNDGFKTYNEYTEVCSLEGVIPKPTIPSDPAKPAKTSLFCKRGKINQMKKACYHKKGFKGIVQRISGTQRRMILEVEIQNMKQWRGKSITMNIMVKSKCVQKWNGKKIVLFTNKIPKVNGKKGYFINVTNKDFLMRNSRRNRNLVYNVCFRS